MGMKTFLTTLEKLNLTKEESKLLMDVRYKKIKIDNIKNILEAYQSLSSDEVLEFVEVLEGIEQITYAEYTVKLQDNLKLLEKEYVSELSLANSLMDKLNSRTDLTEEEKKSSEELLKLI